MVHPEIPPEGLPTEALLANTRVDIGNMRNRLKEVATLAGLPLEQRGMVYDSRLAQELGCWAESQNNGALSAG